MLCVYEERRHVRGHGLYHVRSWLLFGKVPMFQRWTQLTTVDPTPSEKK